MAENPETIKEFQTITGANEQESKFYLESHEWDIEDAVLSYFEANQGQPPQQRQSQPQQVQSTSSPTSTASSGGKKTTSSSSRGGVRTLSDFHSDDENDDEDEDEEGQPQNYFTGGEKSGLMVQSAPKSKKSSEGKDEVVDNVFQGAKSQGAVPHSEKKPVENKQPTFDGSSYQLGNSMSQQSQKIVHDKPKSQQQEPEKDVKITFWSNGFTVDEGPIRSYDNPANREFLDDIKNSVVPKELANRNSKNGVPIVLVDSRNKEWTEPPKPKYVAFSGGGHSLGSTSTTTTTSTPSTSTSTTTNNNNNRSATVNVDKSKPTTTVQIRLADGSKLQTTFNQDHTIADVINFINSSMNNSRGIELLTGFPQKPITTDPNTSLKDAGLLNALIIQKFK